MRRRLHGQYALLKAGDEVYVGGTTLRLDKVVSVTPKGTAVVLDHGGRVQRVKVRPRTPELDKAFQEQEAKRSATQAENRSYLALKQEAVERIVRTLGGCSFRTVAEVYKALVPDGIDDAAAPSDALKAALIKEWAR